MSSDPLADTVKRIAVGSTVTMHYSLVLEDGTLVESTFDHGEPLTFTMGDGSLVVGLEAALLGLKAGDQQSLAVEPDVAFGYPDESAVHTLKRSEFTQDMSLQAGLVIEFETPSGIQVPGTIKEVNDDNVLVDFSHPLAGRHVMFNVHILNVQ